MSEEASKIVEVLKEKTNSKNYSELAEKLGLTSSSLSLAKSRGSIGLLLEAAYLFSSKHDINLLQYLSPNLSPHPHQNEKIKLFNNQFETLKLLCENEHEFEMARDNFVSDSINLLNKTISKKIIDNLLKIKEETPLLQRLRGLVWFNDIGATVSLYSIFIGVSKEEDGRSAKEKFLDYCDHGHFSVPQFNEARSIFREAVSNIDDEMCEYILKNQNSFTEALKTLTPAAENAITGNQKFEDAKKTAIKLAKGIYGWLTKS